MVQKVWIVCLSLGIFALLEQSIALCPDYNVTDCVQWSDNTTWPSLQVPEDGDFITINKCVIFDVHSPRLQTVDITSQGKLIFSPLPEADVALTANNIRVAGLLRIGSARCRYDGKAQITLTGSSQDATDSDFGRKYIGVTEGGALELHGARKTPWSKVNVTLPKLTTDNGLYFDSKTEEFATWKPGFLVYVVNPENGAVRHKDIFYTGGDSQWHFDRESENLISLLKWVPEGDVIAMAANMNPVTIHFNMTPIFEAIEKAFYCRTGNSRIRYLQPDQAWVGIAVKEHSHRAMERVGRHLNDNDFRTAVAELKMPLTNFVIRVLSKRHERDHWRRETRIVGATYDGGVPIVTMTDDVSSWQPGDKVVITSTDFDWKQAEEATVETCDIRHRNITCNPDQVRLSYNLQHVHWGEVNHRVDMRAEIALLSRNVRVIGEVPVENGGDDQKFGGQIKIKANFSDVHIQGVQLSHMGQMYEQDAYPIFFDMCFNVSADNYPNSPYVRENAIVDSFRSCVVLRGTHGMLIEGNVAYRHFGSCYYLLEGGEKYNRFVGNIGLGTEKLEKDNPTLMEFEKSYVATFFITNPLTYFQNNVAAGGEARGIMFAFPHVPLRDSRNYNFMQEKEATHTPLAAFENNVVHSNREIGLDMQYSIKADTSYHWNSEYEPKENPLDEDSPDTAVYIERLTSYKNRYENVNARGGLYIYHRSSISDSSSGFILRTSSNQRQYIEKSVILGESANQGEPTTYWYKNDSKWESIQLHRSIPLYWNIYQPILGVLLTDGPTFLYEVWFNNFVYTDYYQVGAIGFVRKNRWATSALTSCEEIYWGFDDGSTTGNRVYDGDAEVREFGDETGDKQAMFRDLDGSVTGLVDSTVVKPLPMILTIDCTLRDNWNMAICGNRYGKISVRYVQHADRPLTPLMSRDDVPTQPLDQNWKTSAEFPVVLGGDYSYILFFNSSMPQGVQMWALGVEKDLWVRIGMCVPVGAEVQLWSYSPDWRPNIQTWNEVMSVAELEATNISSSYFWDQAVGVIFFKFKSDLKRKDSIPYEMAQCPEDKCPMLRLTITNADAVDMSNGDCRERAYGPYVRSARAAHTKSATTSNTSPALLATSQEPPEDFGAGPVYASDLVIPKDGGFGQWVEWSDCTASCGGGYQYRKRTCEDANGCNGPSTERGECNTFECVDEDVCETAAPNS